MSTIGELSNRLLSRRPNVEPILSQLFLGPSTNLVVDTSDSLSIEQCDLKHGNSKAKETSSSAEVSKSKKSQETENKGKGNNSKKNKKGKRGSKK